MPIILIVIKASVLLAAALGGAWLLRAAPAATRHALWSVTFAALLALPWLGAAVPAVPVPLPRAWAAAASGCTKVVPGPQDSCVPDASERAGAPGKERVPGAGAVATPAAVRSGAVSGRYETAAGPETAVAAVVTQPAIPSIGAAVRAVWFAGAAAAAGALFLSLLRVRRLARTAADVADPAWHDAVQALGTRLALRRPVRVVVSDAVRTPMAGGLWRHVIFLPADAASWTAGQRDVVLAHELAHIAERDPLRHLAARLAVACYWFHPLAWIAARQSSLAREEACDQAVLALGIRPSEYARVLLDLAESMTASPAAALPMVERSLLETRLMAILDSRTTTSRLRRPIVPVASAALLALVITAAQPAARAGGVQPATPVTPAAAATPADAVASVTPAALDAQSSSGASTSCWAEMSGSSDFSGYSNTDSRGAIVERVGMRDSDLIIQQHFGDVRVCMSAQGVTMDRGATPATWAARSSRVTIESVRSGSTNRLDIVRQNGGAAQTTWRVNGTERPFDAAAQTWRDAMLAVLDRSWEISSLRGEESSLRGDISSLRGDESSLRGDISSIHGDISSLRGDISSVRGDESSLRGDISSIRGNLSSLEGDISSERGAISSLESERYGRNDQERARAAREVDEHRAAIARLEREIAGYDAPAKIGDVEKQLRALNADAKVAEIEKQIRDYGEQDKVAGIQKQIEALNVDGKTRDIERRITALDVDRRTREIKNQLDEAVKRLERALAAIK